MKSHFTDTIAAIATPRGAGGIAIIKISGPEALAITRRIFQPKHRTDPWEQSSGHQQMVYGYVVHPEHGAVLDEVLIAVMYGPRTYTTEDVVEINCHGGAVVTQDVLDLVLAQGARVADPGEFTRRAFLGGRINLAQAEAVIDLINAKTRKAAQAGLHQLSGGIDQKVKNLQAQLLEILAEIEVYIDFDDELEEPLSISALKSALVNDILPAVLNLISSYREGRILRDGLRIVIAGRPNVGKSSLVNRLLNQERVIVTAIPGTTRDIIEESIDVGGIPVVITDTAGIHESRDPIESIGIEKSEQAIDCADLVLFMMDCTAEIQSEDKRLYDRIKDKNHLLIQNKIDLREDRAHLPSFKNKKEDDYVHLSALTGEGLDALKNKILSHVGLDSGPESSHIVVNLRQRALLESVRQHLEKTLHLLGPTEYTELIAIEINDALRNLQEILGQGATQDVLDHIFKRFCIGK
ncbi:MAG: tRNA uridine-5-carboxymethylaminomethyl(34) synthesis GTPase MnmE [Desulfosarcina sp.]|nr:tRNA uridine-5-carboxymethylaminomethyl(34) synthesis GTPase MnmE [Desulfobacterales bacterium]